MNWRTRALVHVAFLTALVFINGISARSQSVASGTVQGTVTDSTGAVVVGAKVEIKNPITGYDQEQQTDATGSFRFNNVPFNNYHIEVTQPGFDPGHQDVNVRSVVPVAAKIALAVGGVSETVNVEATGEDLVETAPYAHVDVDLSSFGMPLPNQSQSYVGVRQRFNGYFGAELPATQIVEPSFCSFCFPGPGQ